MLPNTTLTPSVSTPIYLVTTVPSLPPCPHQGTNGQCVCAQGPGEKPQPTLTHVHSFPSPPWEAQGQLDLVKSSLRPPPWLPYMHSDPSLHPALQPPFQGPEHSQPPPPSP